MSIDKLTDAECEITECVARRLNVVIEAVEALRRMFERHIAAEDGADGEGVLRRERGGLCGWCGQPLEPDWASEKAHMMEAYAALRAENVAMRKALSIARKEADWQRAEARVRREDGARICAERDAAQARVAELEKEIVTLKHAVREARGNQDYGHTWTPNDTQYVRDAIAALRAALGEEATDAH